ncbi:MAG: alpha/beta fold hydrolase [Pseudomonadota bacterium]|nr:alpha/beta fold hydrolase [Pseudomonadota bacterium]
MPFFSSAGVDLAYELAGEGPAVVLIHGFASNAKVNWIDTGWVKTLTEGGYLALTFDNRGHGRSSKLYDPGAYPAPVMAEDARRLIAHLGLESVAVIGYSMGARIAAFLAIQHPSVVSRAVLAGLAENLIRGLGGSEEIAQALEAENADRAATREARDFRKFAERTGSDLRALAACMRSARQRISVAELALITSPVLVVAGGLDSVAGPVAPLVKALANATGLTLDGRNHMSAVGDRQFKSAVLEFLAPIRTG